MAGLPEIRKALADTLEGLPSLTGYPQAPTSAPLLPAVIVMPKRIQFGRAMGGGTKDAYEFELIVVVQTADSQLAQATLDPYLSGYGTKSIRQALFLASASKSGSACLGGLFETRAAVTEMVEDSYGAAFTFGGTSRYLGAALACAVTTPAATPP
jgi:hypothetical protein